MPSLLLPPTTNLPISKNKSHLTQLQLYAVEKWLVDRSRHCSLLLVYTGVPTHLVELNHLDTDDPASLDAAILAFRRDGAKPKQTPNGVVMVTSLAHFRSDWSIVNIPEGNWPAASDQLFANINLLRMGCSGRSALSLNEPSDTTKDRFIALYHLPETTFSPPDQKRLPTLRGKTKDNHTFTTTVLELVKLIQSSLVLFGYYVHPDPSHEAPLPIDGLLCDTTLDAIGRWMSEIGEPLLGLDPPERVVDPIFVAAILSLVLAVRNKLAVLIALDFSNHQDTGLVIPPPKDPFVFPHAFLASLTCYMQATGSTSPAVPHTLTPQTIASIDAAYEVAMASRKRSALKPTRGPTRKVLRNKLDELKPDSDGEHAAAAVRDHYLYNYRSGGEDSPHPPSSSHVPSPSLSAPHPNASSPLGLNSGKLHALTSLSPTPSTTLGLSSLTSTVNDLASFLSIALTKEKDVAGPTLTGLYVRAHAQGRREKEKRRKLGGSISVLPDSPATSLGKTSNKTRESVDLGLFYQPSNDPEQPRVLDTVIAGSVKALWSGRVAELVHLRECASVSSFTVPSPLPLSAHSLSISRSTSPQRSATIEEGSHPPSASIPASLRVPSSESALRSRSPSWGRSSRSKSKHKIDLATLPPVESQLTGDPHSPNPTQLISSGPTAAVPANIHSDPEHLKSETEDEPDSEGVYNSAPNGSQTALNSSLSAIGGRVKGKLGTWTALAKRRATGAASVDLSNNPGTRLPANEPVSVESNVGHVLTPVTSQEFSTRDRRPGNDGTSGLSGMEEEVSATKAKRSRFKAKHLSLPAKPIRLPSTPSGLGGLSGLGGRGSGRGRSGSIHEILGSGKTLPTGVAMGAGNASAAGSTSGLNRQGGTGLKILTTRMGSGSGGSGGPQSPTLPPLSYASGQETHGEDEGDLLSSGQISPSSDYKPNPFNILTVPTGQALGSSTSNVMSDTLSMGSTSTLNAVQDTANQLHSRLLDLDPSKRRSMVSSDGGRSGEPQPPPDHPPSRRPSLGTRRLTAPSALPRITSWSDPLSARYIYGIHSFHTDSPSGTELSDAEEDFADEDGQLVCPSGAEGFAEFVDSDGPASLRTAMPLPTAQTIGGGAATSPPQVTRPRVSRKRTLAPSTFTAGSDGELPPFNNTGVSGHPLQAHANIHGREKARFHSLLSVVGSDGQFNEELVPLSAEPDDYAMSYDAFSGDEEGERDGEGWMRLQRSLRRRGCFGTDNEGAPERPGQVLLRRRSFHDLDDFRGMSVLTPERMRIDVEICGQMLTMARREEHLRNVVACLKILNIDLSTTNSLLRQDYENNLSTLQSLASSTRILGQIEQQAAQADKLAQSTNVVRYEAEQLHVRDLWHATALSREKVLSLRQTVFGEDIAVGVGNGAEHTRKRRLHEGERGAHGRFNRLQRTVGGEERLVDAFGRTESEVDEEEALVEERGKLLSADEGGDGGEPRPPRGAGRLGDRRLIDVDFVTRADIAAATARDARDKKIAAAQADEEEAAEHWSIRPMWLLRFFVGWGARWSARAAASNDGDATANLAEGEISREPVDDEPHGGENSPIHSLSSLDLGQDTDLGFSSAVEVLDKGLLEAGKASLKPGGEGESTTPSIIISNVDDHAESLKAR